MLSFGAVAQEKKQESQAGQTPSMTQEQKPGSEAQGSASGSTSTPSASTAEKKSEGSAAAGGTAAKKSEGSAAAGGSSMSHDAETVKQVQTKLNVQADGKMGPATQKAVKEFQTSKGLNATGHLDQQTLSALGIESAAGGASKAKSAKADKKAEGSAAAGASTSTETPKSEGSASAGASTGAAGSPTTEQKPQQPPAPAKTETKPGEKKY